MKAIKYRVTDAFGCSGVEVGDIIRAYLICEGFFMDTGLVFHPASKHECASLDICWMPNLKEDVWESRDDSIFVNLKKADASLFERFIIDTLKLSKLTAPVLVPVRVNTDARKNCPTKRAVNVKKR